MVVRAPEQLVHSLLTPGPPSLTGGQKKKIMIESGVKVGVDWLQATVPMVDEPLNPNEEFYGEDPLIPRAANQLRDELLLAASVALGCDQEDWAYLDVGINGYRESFIGPGSARVLFNHPTNRDVHLVLPGKACGMVAEDAMRSLLRYVMVHGGHASRIDVKADDYEKNITPDFVRQQLISGDAVTHAKKSRHLLETEIGPGGLETGSTVYIGSPRSRQLIRIYDKGLESGGEIDAIRWELQTRKAAAVSMLQQLAYGSWPSVIASRIVAFVDFRDSSKAVNTSDKTRDRPRSAWFALLVGTVEKGLVYLPQLAKTVSDVIDWIDRQVGTSLAVVMKFWKGDFSPLVQIMRQGEERLKPRHFAMLAKAL